MIKYFSFNIIKYREFLITLLIVDKLIKAPAFARIAAVDTWGLDAFL